MPKSVTALGGKRTGKNCSRSCKMCSIPSRLVLNNRDLSFLISDYGLLGAGLYFGGESCTSAQYTSAGARGTRFMLLNKVALGNIHEVYEITSGLSTNIHPMASCSLMHS